MTWNLHITGSALETDIEKAVNEFSARLTALGHVVEKVIFTNDKGQRQINPIIQDVAKVAETVDPAITPAVDTVEKVATEVADATSNPVGFFDEIKTEAADLLHKIEGKSTN